MAKSQHLGVKAGSEAGHFSSFVVFVHLWEVVTIVGELGASLVPPNGEVFTDSAAKISAVRSRLRHKLMELLAGTAPIGGLNTHKE